MYQTVPIQQIEPLESNFCFRYTLKDDDLLQSVKQFGIMVPLSVIPQGNGRWGLFSGFKRFYAALELKSQDIPISICEKNLSDLDLLKLNLELNHGQVFHDLDIAVLVSKLTNDGRVGNKVLLQELLPKLGVKLSEKHIKNYQQIEKLDKRLLDQIYENNVPFKGSWRLAELSKQDQLLLLEEVLSVFHFSSSDMLNLFDLMNDVFHLNGKKIADLLLVDTIKELLARTKNRDEKLRAALFLDLLRGIRYPTYFAAQKEHKAKVARMKFDSKIQIHKSESMEEEGVELRARITDKSSLSRVIQELEEKKAQIEEIL